MIRERVPGIYLLLMLLHAAAGCRSAGIDAAPLRTPEARVFAVEMQPAGEERYCAWYGHARGGVLYFGEAAFWSSMRRLGGDPAADLAAPGPQQIGRFDLRAERFLAPLDVTRPGARSGVWDVYAHPQGGVYFTTFFESMGRVDETSGAVEHFDALGSGLNEIAPGPDGNLLVSRYAAAPDRSGSVLLLRPDGALLAEWPLASEPGALLLPKTVAWDPRREEIWLSSDVLIGDAMRHDALVLDRSGREIRRIVSPEIQFIAFDDAGNGLRAEVEGSALTLVQMPRRGDERRIPLDADFDGDFDFVQDIQFDAAGRAAVTRWSGFVHLVDPAGRIDTLRLPQLEPGGLYYTAVRNETTVCATHCGISTVVCR